VTSPAAAGWGTEPTTLLLVRHASTEWTASRRVCGGDDAGPALSDEGVEEARRLAKALAAGELAALVPEPVAVVSSPQLRARQTADVLAAGLPGMPDPAVTEDDAWGELRFGAWHGLTYAEVRAGWADEFRAWAGSTTATPPGGESLDALAARVAAATGELAVRHPGAAVLVVSHVGPVRAAVAGALGDAAGAYWRLRVSPASLSVVRRWPDGGAEVAAVNLGGRL
jgi:ribonuclease H / adenosylcobalamin/alpha-ribazole phosphatase